MSTYKKDSPRFDGTNYCLWKIRMECHLKCMGDAYWLITKDKYEPPEKGPSTPDELKDAENKI